MVIMLRCLGLQGNKSRLVGNAKNLEFERSHPLLARLISVFNRNRVESSE